MKAVAFPYASRQSSTPKQPDRAKSAGAKQRPESREVFRLSAFPRLYQAERQRSTDGIRHARVRGNTLRRLQCRLALARHRNVGSHAAAYQLGPERTERDWIQSIP